MRAEVFLTMCSVSAKARIPITDNGFHEAANHSGKAIKEQISDQEKQIASFRKGLSQTCISQSAKLAGGHYLHTPPKASLLTRYGGGGDS